MRKVYAILLFGLAFQINCFGQTKSPDESPREIRQQFVGIVIGDAISDDLKQIEHFLISSKSNVEIPLEYGIRRVTFDRQEMLWLERVDAFDDKGGVKSWKVLDVLLLPTLGPKQVLATQHCFVRKEYEPEIIAIFSNQDREYLIGATKAWRANRLRSAFEQIPVNDLRCENPQWNIP